MKRRRGQNCAHRLLIERLEERILLAADDTLAIATNVLLTAGVTKSISDQIDPTGDVDLYKVKLGFGDTLTAQIVASSLGSSLDSYLRIFDSMGNELASNDDGPSPPDAKLKFTTTAAGFFFVGVSDNANVFYDPNVSGSGSGASTGDYTLNLTKVLFADAGDTLTTANDLPFIRGVGKAVHGEIATGLDVDVYRLNLVAGDTLNVGVEAESQGSTLAGRLRLFDASGNQLSTVANSGSGDPSLGFSVVTSGTYYVAVSGAGNSSYNPKVASSGVADSVGDYQLDINVQPAASVTAEVEPNNSIDAPNVIDVNTNVAGSIGAIGDADFYMFTVTDAGQLTAQVTAAAGSHLDARLTLFGGDHQIYSTSEDRAVGNVNPLIILHLTPGTYFLKVDSSVAGTGTYQLSTALVDASSPFLPHETGFSPTGISAGDFNGDGIADLVTADKVGGASILLGLGDLSYKPATSLSVGSQPVAVAVGKFDGDQRLDIAVANSADGTVSILLGNGDGTFALQTTFTVGSNPQAIAVADFNHDGKLDLAVANADSGNVTLLFGDGNGHFAVSSTQIVGTSPWDITAGDFNGDNRPDLGVANRGSGDISILINDGNGGFLAQQTYSVGTEPTSIVAARFNADGFLDLAVANAGSDDVSLLFGHGDGTFTAESRIDVRDAPDLQSSGDFRSFVAATDFNGDGIADLVVGHSQDSRISVALGNGDGTFKRRNEFFGGDVQNRPWAVVVADLNGDGRADFATTDGQVGHLSVFGGLGDGSFLSGSQLNVGNDPRSIVATDVNHDGHVDLISASNGNDSRVMLGNGNTSFQDAVQFDSGHSNAIAVGDFNRDGRPDIVSVNFFFDLNSLQSFNQIVIALGLGDGTYAPLAPIDAGLFLSAVVVGDFNSDGKLDLAVTSEFQNSVLVLSGNGDGTFGSPTQFIVGSLPTSLALGDFDHDGKLDLATANSASNDVSILLGAGNGNFAAQPPLAVGDTPMSLATGDFNGDGVDDLAVTNSGGGTVTVLVGAANGNFAAANTSPLNLVVGDNPLAIVAGDFNGDGRTDIATASQDSNDVSVLLNVGGGQFAAQKRFSISAALNVADRPSAITTGDFNGDGVLDLATSNNGSRNISILSGRGDGTFAPPGDEASAGNHPAPVLADVNGDGVADSLVLDRAGNVLLRLGRKDIKGTFASPLVVNPGAPASSFVVLKDGKKTTLAIMDRSGTVVGVGNSLVTQHFVTLYSIAKNGTPNLVSKTDLGESFSQIAAVKLNGDNRDDLAAIDSTTGTLGMFLRSGAGFDVASAKRMPVAGAPSDLLTASLDGIGGMDVLVADQRSGTVNVVLGGFASPQSAVRFRSSAGPSGVAAGDEADAPGAPLVFDGPTALAMGDFNEDGAVDVVAAQRGANSLGLLLGKGNGSFINPIGILAGSRPIAVQVADLNGDKHLDLAVLNEGSHDVSVFLGDGHGHFALKGSFDVGNSPVGLSIVDVNGDKKLDLMVGNEAGDVTNLLGNGDGTFKPFARINRNMAIAVGDLNGDGKQDWVVANSTSDRIAVQSGAAPVFGRSDGVAAPANVKLADLDGDGIADMIVANSGGNDVLVYRGLGGGQFAAANSFAAGSDPVEVQVADVGGVDGSGHFVGPDGELDVIVTNFGSNDVSILLNTGNSSGGGEKQLTPGVRLNVGQGPVSTQVVQQPGQANPSLLVTNSVSNQVTMLSGLGNGFFNDLNPTVFNTGRDPTQTLVGNFDGRGLGFVTLNYNSNSLTFYSLFDPASRHDMSSGGENPLTAIAADMNSDGITDLVVGNNGNGVFSIFDGGQSGLNLLNAFVSDSVDHPAAMALAQLGQGQELQLLALDEGDELVHVFSRDTLDGKSSTALLASLNDDANSTAAAAGSGPSSIGLFVSLVAAVGVTVDGFITDIGQTRGLGGGAEANRAFSEFFEHLGEAFDNGRQWIKSAVEGIENAVGGEIDAESIVTAVEDIVSILFPQVPVKAVPAIFKGVFNGSPRPSNISPTAIDGAHAAGETQEWVTDLAESGASMISMTATHGASERAAEPSASDWQWSGALSSNGQVPMNLNAIDVQSIATIVDEQRTVLAAKSGQPGQNDQKSYPTRRRLGALAAVMASIGAGGYVYRLRRREND